MAIESRVMKVEALAVSSHVAFFLSLNGVLFVGKKMCLSNIIL